MATPFSDVTRFRITYNVSPQTITFTDLIQSGYAAYGSVSDFKGIIQVTDPFGTIVYQGAGYSLTNPDFSSPDIIGAGTPVWIKTGIPTTQGSNGLISDGQWTFDYLVTMNGGTSVTHIQKKYNFDYLSPKVAISMVADCKTSTLVSEDVTELTVHVGTGDFEPIAITRTHTIQKPLGSGANDPGYLVSHGTTGEDRTRVIGGGNTDATRLWTRIWQTEVELALQYNLETWKSDTWLVVLDDITGNDFLDVRCDTEYCNLRTCVSNVIDLWNSAMDKAFGHAAELQTNVVQILSDWMLYEQAQGCGADTQQYITSLKKHLSKIKCLDEFNTDDKSRVVYAIGTALVGGGGGGGGSLPTISYGTIYPTGGIAGSLYIWRDDEVNPTFVKAVYNSGGTWIIVANLLGDAGSSGADGSNNSSANILYNPLNTVGTPSGTGNEILDEYSLPGGTLVNIGDVLEIVAVFDLALNPNGKKPSIVFAGDLLVEFFTDALITSKDKTVVLRARIHKVSVNSQKIDAYIETESGIKVITATATKNLAAALLCRAYGQNSVSNANDIVLKSFTVSLYSVLTTIPTSIRNWDAGYIDLVADVLTPVPLSVTMPSSNYNISVNGWDIDGFEQDIQIPQNLKTPTVFYAKAGVNVRVNWSVTMV